MQQYVIDEVLVQDHKRVLEVWEQSVKATHHFLDEDYHQFIKTMIWEQYLPNHALLAVRDQDGQVIAFMGVTETMLDSLFVAPDWFQKGVGSTLVKHAITVLGVNQVDVNEENPGAIQFYQKFGFEMAGRSELDGQGRAHPILHLRLK